MTHWDTACRMECRRNRHRQRTRMGRDSCTRLCFRLDRGPSTSAPASRKWHSKAFQSPLLDSTRGLPSTTTPSRARVSATFSRRGSDRKPMPCGAVRAGTEVME